MDGTTVSSDAEAARADRVLAELESLELITDDGATLETIWHRKCMNLLIEQIEYHFRDRDDFYVAGNTFIYFSPEQARNRDFRGPHFFYVSATTRQPTRECWVVWNEDLRRPDVVIELSSPSTREEDHGSKFRIYRDTLEVKNYFIYDPDTRLLEGWRLEKRRYVPIRPDENGRLLSDELDLLLGKWEGEYVRDTMVWLRFFDKNGQVIPIFAEAEKQRSEAIAAENARLKELLAKVQSSAANGPSPTP
jgi:Uma2 family endonuclease